MDEFEGAREAEGPCAERGKGSQTDAGLALIGSMASSMPVTPRATEPPQTVQLFLPSIPCAVRKSFLARFDY